MNRFVLKAGVGFCVGVGFAFGWLHEREHSDHLSAKPLNISRENPASDIDCEHAPQSDWFTVRGIFYEPNKTLYNADWEYCNGDLPGERVRIMDANDQHVFFQFENDEVLRLEKLRLLDNDAPQLLVLTESTGTGDDIDWHVISESKGALEEWKKPDYDGPAQKLLGSDEDFCCKDWNFHLEGNDVVLARGIYRKGDGNCCPSRGGVLVRLQPTNGAFKLVSAARISKPEYDRWSWTLCSKCNLYY
ncbi:MAG TPA: hypothetical protein VN579_08990 [Bryobacteraceae bacterium]|nr:hypothetical protein [Bryobacteraceae bacterium]